MEKTYTKQEFEDFINNQITVNKQLDYLALTKIIDYYCFSNGRNHDTLTNKDRSLLKEVYSKFHESEYQKKFIEDEEKSLKLLVELADDLLENERVTDIRQQCKDFTKFINKKIHNNYAA